MSATRYLRILITAIISVAAIGSPARPIMADQGVSRDLGFGNNGRVDLGLETSSVDQHVQALADGSIAVINGSPATTKWRYFRYSSDGTLDPAFPTGHPMTGSITLASVDLPTDPAAAFSWLDAAGGVYTLYRDLTTSLSFDTSLNGTGFVTGELTRGPLWTKLSMVRLADGSYAISGRASTPSPTTEIIRLASDGSRIATFGVGGVQTIAGVAGEVVGATAAGQLVLSAADVVGKESRVIRLTPTGEVETTYGTNGVAANPPGEVGGGQRLLVEPDGKVIVARSSATVPGVRIHRVLSDGTIDPTFGTAGVTSMSSDPLFPSTAGIDPLEPLRLTHDQAGRIILSARTTDGTGAVVVLAGDGTPDGSFGDGGAAVISEDLQARDLAIGRSGEILTVGTSGGRGVLQRSMDSRPWPPTSPPPAVASQLEKLVDGFRFRATWATVTNPDPEVKDVWFWSGLSRLDDQTDRGFGYRPNGPDVTSVEFSNLRHGNYVFSVFALNKFGMGTPSQTSFSIPRWNRTVEPLSPVRVFDSRPGSTTVDGAYEGGGVLDAGSTTAIHLWGRGGILPTAHAVGVNITAVAPSSNGFVTAYPCRSERPNAASINYIANTTVASGSIATIDAPAGDLCVYSSAATHLVVDVSSQYAASTPYEPFTPARLVDSRADGQTVDGLGAAIGLRAAGSTTVVHLSGRNRVPTNALAVALNLTAVAPTGNGFMTMYPCGTLRPNASNINYSAGRTTSNSTIAVPDANGDVCVYTSAPSQLVIDASGSILPGADYSTSTASRLLDTRLTGTTVDGQFQRAGTRAPGTTTVLHVADRGFVTSDPTAVSLNITAVAPVANGYITAYRCDIARPQTSNINYVAGRTIANFSVAETDDQGNICIYNSAAMNIVVDVSGTFQSSGV